MNHLGPLQASWRWYVGGGLVGGVILGTTFGGLPGLVAGGLIGAFCGLVSYGQDTRQ